MDLVAVIPARGGSKGLRAKNIYPVNNKPLISFTINCAFEICKHVYVSSDDQHILDIASDFGAIPLIRPKNISTDVSSTEVVLKHAEKVLSLAKRYEYVVYLSACEPLRPPGTLSSLLDQMLKDKDSPDTIFYGRPTHRHFWSLTPDLSERPIMNWMSDYTPRQKSVNQLLLESTGYGLITRPEYWANGIRFGGKCSWRPIPESIPDLDIHSLNDINLLENILKLNPNLVT